MIKYKNEDFELFEIKNNSSTDNYKTFKVLATEIKPLDLLKKIESGSQLYFDIYSIIVALWGSGDYELYPYLDIEKDIVMNMSKDSSVNIAVKKLNLIEGFAAGIKRSVKFPLDSDDCPFAATKGATMQTLSCDNVKISLVKSKEELTSAFIYVSCEGVDNINALPDCLRYLHTILSIDMEKCINIHQYSPLNSSYMEKYIPVYTEYDNENKKCDMVFRNKFTQTTKFLSLNVDYSFSETKRIFSKEPDGSILIKQSFNIMSLTPENVYKALDDDELDCMMSNKMKHLLVAGASILSIIPIFYKLESRQYKDGVIDTVVRYYPAVLVDNKRDAGNIIKKMRKGALSMCEDSLFVRENTSGVSKIYYSYTNPKSRICIINMYENNISARNFTLLKNLIVPEFVDDLKLADVIPYITYNGDIFLNIDRRGKSEYLEKIIVQIIKEKDRLLQEKSERQ